MTVIPITKPTMGKFEAEVVHQVISSGSATQEPEVAAVKREFAELVGASHACAVSSCTAALDLALLVAGVSTGDELIKVNHSCIAIANSIRYCRATPVFVDIKHDSYNINPELIEPALTDKTKAILVVHHIGMPCDLQRIVPIARKHYLPLIEDAVCLSFHPRRVNELLSLRAEVRLEYGLGRLARWWQSTRKPLETAA